MEEKILELLINQKENLPHSYRISNFLDKNHDEIVGCLKSLESREYIEISPLKVHRYVLTSEGKEYAVKGTPEYNIFKELVKKGGKEERKSVEALFGGLFKIGLQNGIKKLFNIEGQNLVIINDKFEDEDSDLLKKLADIDYFDERMEAFDSNPRVKQLKTRKLIELKVLSYFTIKPGQNFTKSVAQKKADLNYNDLVNENWKNIDLFKKMNLSSKGKEVSEGGLHPLLKLRSEFRCILLEMGFEEMKTNNYVESSFWNFDALYQPQQHPARDSHDTFFLKTPSHTKINSEEMSEYLEKVKEIHETGYKDFEIHSTGWKYQFSKEETTKNILRTHTTAISSRYLKLYADKYLKDGIFEPKKLFSIDRVFRNESLDATHLAEFHQIEGLIIGKNLGLAQLKCFIKDFFAKIGIHQLKFKPAYNPYTEPSMEIFCHHPVLNRTIEIGNSGVFRPEMLKPMGWPEDVSVIAWGLSLERPAMILFSCGNIRELFGYKVNIRSVKESPLINL